MAYPNIGFIAEFCPAATCALSKRRKQARGHPGQPILCPSHGQAFARIGWVKELRQELDQYSMVLGPQLCHDKVSFHRVMDLFFLEEVFHRQDTMFLFSCFFNGFLEELVVWIGWDLNLWVLRFVFETFL